MRNRGDFRTQVGKLMQDGANVIPIPEYDDLIDRSLEQYSRKVPRTVVIDVVSDGSGSIALGALTGFDPEFSGDPKIEHPVSTDGEPNFLDRRDWFFHDEPDGRVIRLRVRPGPGDVRFTYKAQHSVTEADSTVAESDFHAVCKLAAAEGCEQIARHYTQTTGGAVADVDLSNVPSKAKEFEERGAKLRKQYNEHVGAGDSGVGAAMATKNLDTTNSLGGDRFTHPRRLR